MKRQKMLSKIFGIGLVLAVIGAIIWGLPALIRDAEASPATVYVRDDYATIQAAKGKANSSGIPYTIDSDKDNYPLVELFEPYGTGAVSPWPMFLHDPQHTGRSPHTGPETPSLKWSYATEHSIGSSPAIGSDGTIYVGGDGVYFGGSYDNKLYAIEPDGTLKWSYATEGAIHSSPAIGPDGTIYVGGDGPGPIVHYLYAINPDGSLKWRYATCTGCVILSSPAIGSDGTIYVGSRDQKIYAINPNGTLKWSYTTEGTVDSSPAIDSEGTIYVGSGDYELYAINPDGTLKWSFATGDPVVSSPAIGSGGTIYVGSNDQKIYAINSDGTLKWSYPTGGAVVSSPAISLDGTIYAGSQDNKLYALNPDGTLKWTYTTGYMIDSSPAIDANGIIYIGSYDCNLYAINSDGTIRWSYATDHFISSSPAIGSDGTVYVGSQDGRLYAIGEATLPPTAYIDSISPNPASQGQTVSFSGHGTDPDPGDSIIGYNWRSSIDGQLSTSSSFTKSNLSVGTHIIYFKVRDSHNTWSTEATRTLTINPSDTIDPNILITSPSDGQIFTTPTITVSGTASDNVGLSKLEVRVGGGSWQLASGTTSWSKQVTLSPGSNTIYARATDTSGNTKETSVTVTYTPPTTPTPPEVAPNNPPSKPSNVFPADGASDVILTPAFQSSAFSDPDTGDTHAASQWQITTTSGDYSSTVFNSGVDTTNLTSIIIPSGILNYSTTYYWHVRHQDNHGAWSSWSEETAFATTVQAFIPELYTVDTNLKVKVSVSAQQLDDFIKNKGTVWCDGKPYNSKDSPLVGLGQAWVDAGEKYGINSVYLMAHAIGESGWGFSSIAQSKHNIYGYGAYDTDPSGYAYTFSSYEECVDNCTGWVNSHYLTPGGTYYHEEYGPSLRGMNIDYAKDKEWADNIAKIMNQFAKHIGYIEVQAHSPVELRVYDSQGWVTGVVNGGEKNEIPYSTFYENTVTIFSPYDLYSYEVVGTGEGLYGLTVERVVEQETSTFTAADIPTSTGAVHQYTIDWDALSQGERGVTAQLDSDGDGKFEKSITSGNELTRDEFVSAREGKAGLPFWIWIAIGVGVVFIVGGVTGYCVARRRV